MSASKHLRTALRRPLLAAVLGAIAVGALTAGASAGVRAGTGASGVSVSHPGLVVVFRQGSGTTTVTESADGYARIDRDARGAILGGYSLAFHHEVNTIVLDGKARRYEQMPLRDAVRKLKRLRAQMFSSSVYAPTAFGRLPVARAARADGSRTIRGHRAFAITETLRGASLKAWFVQPPVTPPAAVTRALRALQPVSGAAVPPGAIAVQVEQQQKGAWHAVVSASKVSSEQVPASAFLPPAGWKRGPILTAGPEAFSVPATVRRTSTLGYLPLQTHQTVFAVYWGARFGREPATVARLNASFNVIEHAPYVTPLGQYDGIGEGRLSGSTVVPTNPPADLGNADITGIANATGMVNRMLFAPGAPGTWLRPAAEQPLYVLFVPSETVTTAGNLGYHAGVPVATAWLDPLGLIQLQAVPYAVVKVPALAGGSNIDAATDTLSHETVETATDPWGIGGWRQVGPPAGEQGEVSDICQEGNTGPFRSMSRVGGVVVATYWSQRDNACVPESRPSVRITAPAAGASIPWGTPVALRAVATDPLDGTLLETSIRWTLDGAPVTLTSAHLIPLPSPGRHTATATVTNSQGATPSAPASVSFVVGAISALTVSIDTPSDFQQFGDGFSRPITFTATARDASGTRGDATYTWTDDRDGPLGSGRTISHTLSGGKDVQRVHHVTVTVRTPDGRTASRMITVLSGIPG